MTSAQKFLTRREVAVLMRVSIRTIARWMRRGLPVYRAGVSGRVLIRPIDLEAFLVRWPSQDEQQGRGESAISRCRGIEGRETSHE